MREQAIDGVRVGGVDIAKDYRDAMEAMNSATQCARCGTTETVWCRLDNVDHANEDPRRAAATRRGAVPVVPDHPCVAARVGRVGVASARARYSCQGMATRQSVTTIRETRLEMFKKAEQQVRKVITEFTCTGFGSCALEDIVVVAAGLSMPPILELCSKEYGGEIPHNAIRYDEKAHAAYIRDNTRRAEPAPTLTTMLTTRELCAELGWNENHLRVARASGLLKPSGWKDVPGEEGFAVGIEPLYDLQIVRASFARVQALPVGAR